VPVFHFEHRRFRVVEPAWRRRLVVLSQDMNLSRCLPAFKVDCMRHGADQHEQNRQEQNKSCAFDMHFSPSPFS
jgi:hypothetical protein